MKTGFTEVRLGHAFFVALALPFGALCAQATQVNCGDVLTEDTVLDNDLSDCPGNTLVIGADGITVDLNGHRLFGGGCVSASEEGAVGIRNDGYDRVEIRNGTIEGYGTGILLTDAHHNRIEDCGIHSNFHGVLLIESSRNRMEGLDLQHNCANAIRLRASDWNRIERSEVDDTGFELTAPGIVLVESDRNLIIGNTVTTSWADGIELRSSSGNRISANRLERNRDHGIELLDSNENWIEENDAIENEIGIALFNSDCNRVLRNRSAPLGSSGNGSHGIALLNDSDDNEVRGNTGTNDGDGIFVELGSTGNRLKGNVESGNGAFDLHDENPGCDANWWKNNSFSTSFSDGDCIE